MSAYRFTSESVTAGHPDKVCDQVADAILDSYLEQEPDARVGIEVLYKGDFMVVAGEVTAAGATVDVEQVARGVLADIGYTGDQLPHTDQTVNIHTLITEQSREIKEATDRAVDQPKQLGASDQGIMFGMACRDTPELMPLPIMLSNRLARKIDDDRRAGAPGWLRPDGKTAVTVEYEGERPRRITTVLVSAQHAAGVDRAQVEQYVRDAVLPAVLGDWNSPDIDVIVNPYGSFTLGGPAIDCGMTGRKIVCDTYGGAGRIGGGALSGKDPSKLDRAGAYFTRWVARQIVNAGIATKVELQVAYAFGTAQPLSICVNTFGTGDATEAEKYAAEFDFRPAAITARFALRNPIYRQTAVHGHFGRPELPWEQ